MATDQTRITIAGRARLYLAPIGTIAPADTVVAMPAGWVEAGYTTEDGTSFATDPTINSVRSHQSDHPTRRFLASDEQTLEADLQEWSADNFAVVFAGGEVVEVTPATVPATYKFTPPKAGGRQGVAGCLEIVDGTKRYRFIIPMSEQGEGVELGLPKGEESTLPLRLTVLGNDLTDPWYLLTNDPAFASIAVLAA